MVHLPSEGELLEKRLLELTAQLDSLSDLDVSISERAQKRSLLSREYTQLARRLAGITGTTKLRVLVVDDNLDDLAMFGKWLELMKCDVRTCSTPIDCQQVAREFKPHLAFLDVAMPGMSGIQVARQLRAADLPPFLIVARTGYADQQTRLECLSNGFNLVMPKPEDLEEMNHLLETARTFAGLPTN
jgi:CheY-like chemotaxis protein